MGELLLDWARNILFFMVFLSVISHLLADASYEKYIRFFAGIVLILITVSPLKGGLDFQEKAGRFFEEFSFFQEKEQAGKALSKADQERMGAFLAEYKKEAEARIQETMQAEGVICSQAEVEIEKDEKSGEYGKIRKIILHLKEEKMTSPQDEETKMVKEKAGEEVSVKVEIPPVITKEKQERPGTESKQEQQLKRKVVVVFRIAAGGAALNVVEHTLQRLVQVVVLVRPGEDITEQLGGQNEEALFLHQSLTGGFRLGVRHFSVVEICISGSVLALIDIGSEVFGNIAVEHCAEHIRFEIPLRHMACVNKVGGDFIYAAE